MLDVSGSRRAFSKVPRIVPLHRYVAKILKQPAPQTPNSCLILSPAERFSGYLFIYFICQAAQTCMHIEQEELKVGKAHGAQPSCDTHTQGANSNEFAESPSRPTDGNGSTSAAQNHSTVATRVSGSLCLASMQGHDHVAQVFVFVVFRLAGLRISVPRVNARARFHLIYCSWRSVVPRNCRYSNTRNEEV